MNLTREECQEIGEELGRLLRRYMIFFEIAS